MTEEWGRLQPYLRHAKIFNNTIKNQYGHIQGALRTWNNEQAEITDAHVSDLSRFVETLFKLVYPSDSARGKFLAELSEKDAKSAVNAYQYFKPGQVLNDLNQPENISGVIAAHLFEEGISKSKSKYSAITRAEADLREWLSDAKIEYEEQLGRLKQEFDKNNEYVKKVDRLSREKVKGYLRWAKKFRNISEERKARILDDAQETYDNLVSRMDTHVDEYNDKLALHAPTTYWKTKYRGHRNLAIIWSVAFTLMAITTLMMAGFLTLSLITPIEGVAAEYVTQFLLGKEAVSGDYTATSPIIKATGFGAIMALLIWLLKIVARNMQSHQHLAADAKERRVMIMTYLALLRREAGVKDEHMGLVLASIFRPTADGLVKEDGGPAPLPIDMIRILSQRS